MNEKVLKIVEYNKIIERLVEHADSQPGKKLCRELLPMDNLFDIEHAQAQTESALSHLFRKGSISFGNNRDFSYMFGALSVGASLSMPELLQLASFLDNVGRIRNYGLSKDGERSAIRTTARGGSKKRRLRVIFFKRFKIWQSRKRPRGRGSGGTGDRCPL